MELMWVFLYVTSVSFARVWQLFLQLLFFFWISIKYAKKYWISESIHGKIFHLKNTRTNESAKWIFNEIETFHHFNRQLIHITQKISVQTQTIIQTAMIQSHLHLLIQFDELQFKQFKVRIIIYRATANRCVRKTRNKSTSIYRTILRTFPWVRRTRAWHPPTTPYGRVENNQSTIPRDKSQ